MTRSSSPLGPPEDPDEPVRPLHLVGIGALSFFLIYVGVRVVQFVVGVLT